MNRKIEISGFANNSLIEKIYQERKDSLYQHSVLDNEKIKEINKQKPITYDNLLTAIKNLPPHFNNTREFILERLEGYIDRQNCLVAYDKKKFYKNGFCDGVQLMLEILKTENDSLTKL